MYTDYPRILLAGTNSRAGKTTLTMGIILALIKRGLKVQPFKTGPDYIDPTYHTFVSGRICRNLDTWMLPKRVNLELFAKQAKEVDISVIEGVMGLYDGLKDTEVGSSAHLAKILNAPVILIMDTSSLSRSAAAIALGYKEFDKGLDIRGIILNNIGSLTHYRSVKKAIENKTELQVLGFLPRHRALSLPERHLGLIPTDEKAPFNKYFRRLLNLVEENIDINGIIKISKIAAPFLYTENKIFNAKSVSNEVSIAVAQDAAFNFYYQDNFDILRHYGANLVEFSPLKDKQLPRGVAGIYIGGGFPELFASKLAENTELKKHIFQQAKSGMPIYAECAGLMYLAKSLTDLKNREFPMVGIFNHSVKMGRRLSALGYVNIEVLKPNILSNKGNRIRAHLFHWSYLKRAPKKNRFVYKAKNYRQNIILDGLTKRNVLANYIHIHFASNIKLAKNFINSCLNYKKHDL